MTEGAIAPVFVLVHSPLLGPTSWSPVREELARRGRQAIVPSLLGIASAPEPQWRYSISIVRASTIGISAPIILVGHAAAGPLLPAIAGAISGEIRAIILVDTLLPPTSGSASLASARFMKQLLVFAGSGVEENSSWFRQRLAPDLIASESSVAELAGAIPAIPISYFRDGVPIPARWRRWPCAYLLLTPSAYADEALKARANGWAVAAPADTHYLSIVTDPRTVADALLDLVGDLEAAERPLGLRDGTRTAVGVSYLAPGAVSDRRLAGSTS